MSSAMIRQVCFLVSFFYLKFEKNILSFQNLDNDVSY